MDNLEEQYKKLSEAELFKAYASFLRPSYAEFYKKLGYEFHDPSNLVLALTHSSFAYEHLEHRAVDNERLEYLGDAILEFIISTFLFHHNDQIQEGEMTALRSVVVREETLALAAEDINLGAYLLLGHGEELNGGRENPSNLANALEALLAAIYIDCTEADNSHETEAEFFALPPEVYSICIKLLKPYLLQAMAGTLIYDYKSRLIEWSQEKYEQGDLQFKLLSQDGPAHCPEFTVAVLLKDKTISTGVGRSKKEAEQRAAKTALEALR